MIIFEDITYKNFLSVGENAITMNYNDVSSTLIVGENGAGKCLRGNTKIVIDFKTEETKAKFLKFLKNK